MQNTVLCIDIGTTSLKAGLITADGEVVAVNEQRFENPDDRFIAGCWLEKLKEVLEKIDSGIQPLSVEGITISGNGPTVVLDSGLTYLWNEENCSKKSLDKGETCFSLFIPKILALKEKFPEEFKKSRYIFSGPEYLIYVLTGNAVTILPEARFESAYWNEHFCSLYKLPFEKLPPFVSCAGNCGKITTDITNFLKKNLTQINFAEDCPVFAGGPDFVVALIGTKTLTSGKLCDRCGSSEGINLCVNKKIFHEGIRTLPSVISGLWNLSVLIPESGSLEKEARLEKVEQGIKLLQEVLKQNQLEFPSEMAVTGGQAQNLLLLQEKQERLKIEILVPAEKNFIHSELLGDACAGWYGLKAYSSLQQASDNIVKLVYNRHHENI